MSDANRLPNTLQDLTLIEYECRHYGIGWNWGSAREDAPGPLYYLLRHIYNNRDVTIGAMQSHIDTLERELADARRVWNPAKI